MSWKIPLFDIDLGTEETTAVAEILNSGWLTMGETTRRFEDDFKQLTGSKYAFCVNNGTAALHLALAAAGIGPGDEVIVPSLTFVATVNSILYTGATPVFADVVGAHDLTISPNSIQSLITPRTKAIMVVHYAGFPCLMDEILEIADKHNLSVFEDAAHAPGAKLNGQACGTIGLCGCFSFFTNKNMAMGEGGMVLTDDEKIAQKLKLMRSHGMTSLTLDRYKGHNYSYDVVELGYNYRPSELQAAMGIVQLKKLIKNNKKRAELSRYYYQKLAVVDEVNVPFIKHIGQPSYHIMPVLLAENLNRTNFMKYLKENGIQTSIHYPPIHKFTYHQKLTESLRVPLKETEDICSREVTLPLFPQMTYEQIDFIAETIQDFIKEAKAE